MTKKIVKYIPIPEIPIVVGRSAYVIPLNHCSPLVHNGHMVMTSTVKAHDPQTGKFETRNTFYEPIEGDEEPMLEGKRSEEIGAGSH